MPGHCGLYGCGLFPFLTGPFYCIIFFNYKNFCFCVLWLTGGGLHPVTASGSLGDFLNTFSNLFIVIVHYTYQHMSCLAASVDCTHVRHVVHYTHQHMPCLAASVDSTHAHHVVHYTHQHMPCLAASVDCTHVRYVVHYTHQHMPCLAASVDCTHVHHVVHYTYQHMSCLAAS